MNTKANKRAYQQIDLWKRKELIDWVNKKEETMKDWAKRLGINYCTAKHIMKVFRRSGSYETDLMRKKKQKEQELRERVLNDSQFAGYTQIDHMAHKPIYHCEGSNENTHNNTNEQSQESANKNILFEGMNAQYSFTPYNFDDELNNIWRILGDQVYLKFSN